MTGKLLRFIARTQFGHFLERVSQNRDRFLVTRKGEADAVILRVEDYLQAVVKTPRSLAALQRQTRRRGTDKVTPKDVEAEIRAAQCARMHLT